MPLNLADPPARRAHPAPLVLAVGLAALSCFTWLAVCALSGSGAAVYDAAVTQWAVQARSTVLTPLAWLATGAGGTLGLSLLTAVMAAVLVVRCRPRHALTLVAAMAGSSLLTMLLKEVFARARPSEALLLGAPQTTYSFPSGHSLNTAVFAGTLAGFALLSSAPPTRKALAVLAAAAGTAVVGLSRIYLAYHWLTDVLAGWALGAAWTCLVALLFLMVRRRRGGRARRGGALRGTSAVDGVEPPASGAHQQQRRPLVGDDLEVGAS